VNNRSLPVRVEGVSEVQQALDGVKTGVGNRVLRGTLRKVASRANKTAKAGAPRRKGLLKRSIGVVYRRPKRKGGSFAYVVGPRKDITGTADGRKAVPAKYAHLVEHGRKAIRPKKSKLLANKAAGVVFGLTVKAVAGRPFMWPAADEARTAMATTIPADVRRGVKSEAKKYRRKGKTVYAK